MKKTLGVVAFWIIICSLVFVYAESPIPAEPIGECGIIWEINSTYCGPGLVLGDFGFVADDIVTAGRCVKANGNSRCGEARCINASGDSYICGKNIAGRNHTCRNIWFNYRDANPSCSPGVSCGDDSPELEIFETKEQCMRLSGPNCPAIVKQCNDGSYVSWNSSIRGCSYERCPGEGDESTNNTFTFSNGRKTEIKIMPETASERARERLGELGFNISLKEVGRGNDGGARVVYHAESEKEGKMFGLFRAKGKVSAEIDAETGEVISVKRPWWSFLASGF